MRSSMRGRRGPGVLGSGAASLLFALLTSCTLGELDPEEGAGGAGGKPSTSPAALYEGRCGTCHGEEGVGSAKGPQIQSPVLGYATYVVRTGRDDMGYASPMAPFTDTALNDELLGGVLAYLGSFPKPKDGKGLYTRFCGNCHGADALGGRSTEALIEAAHEEPEEFLEKVREGEGDQEYGNRTKYMPSWSASEITDAEVELIAAYVATLGSGTGGAGPDDDDDDDGEEEDGDD